MKISFPLKVIAACLFLFISRISQAQVVFPESAVYYYQSFSPDAFKDIYSSNELNFVKSSNDTLIYSIGAIVSLKVIGDSVFHRVGQNSWILTYDYSLETGDSFVLDSKVSTFDNIKHFGVDSTDKVFLLGKDRRRFYLTAKEFNTPMIVIEGLGSLPFGLIFYQSLNESGTSLMGICFDSMALEPTENSFNTGIANNCSGWNKLVNLPVYDLAEITLFPVPTSNQLTIEACNIGMIDQINIINNLGQIVKTSHPGSCTSQISMNDFSEGFYELEIWFSDSKIIRKKIMK